ncbi:hypothetical protein ACH4FX_30300 [Streptomyces sp. NPDC018019]|uniref:hypothetical protein n=1 Tax=Streptomyces sp. NPDC018019 TaxID=3365030 RepID=UPI0037A53280
MPAGTRTDRAGRLSRLARRSAAEGAGTVGSALGYAAGKAGGGAEPGPPAAEFAR